MPKKNKSFEDELLEFGLFYHMLLDAEQDDEEDDIDYDDDYCDLYFFDDDDDFIEVE